MFLFYWFYVLQVFLYFHQVFHQQLNSCLLVITKFWVVVQNDNNNNNNNNKIYSYSANFICVSRINAQKPFIVFAMDWSQNYTYNLSKCFVEQVRFKWSCKSQYWASFMPRSRWFKKVGAALAKALSKSFKPPSWWIEEMLILRTERPLWYIFWYQYCETLWSMANQSFVGEKPILWLILCSTRSQYSSLNKELIWSNWCILDIILAALFWQHCSQSILKYFAPYNRL